MKSPSAAIVESDPWDRLSTVLDDTNGKDGLAHSMSATNLRAALEIALERFGSNQFSGKWMFLLTLKVFAESHLERPEADRLMRPFSAIIQTLRDFEASLRKRSGRPRSETRFQAICLTIEDIVIEYVRRGGHPLTSDETRAETLRLVKPVAESVGVKMTEASLDTWRRTLRKQRSTEYNAMRDKPPANYLAVEVDEALSLIATLRLNSSNWKTAVSRLLASVSSKRMPTERITKRRAARRAR